MFNFKEKFDPTTSKFEVRIARPSIVAKDKQYPIWDFDMRRHNPYDYLLLVGMLNDRPNEIFMIPTDVTQSKHIRVAVDGNSKWRKYRIWKSQ